MLLQVRRKVRHEQNIFLCKLIHLTAISFSKKKKKTKQNNNNYKNADSNNAAHLVFTPGYKSLKAYTYKTMTLLVLKNTDQQIL